MGEITTWEELKAHQARMEQALSENRALLDKTISEAEDLGRVVHENRRRVAHLKKAIANKATPQEVHKGAHGALRDVLSRLDAILGLLRGESR